MHTAMKSILLALLLVPLTALPAADQIAADNPALLQLRREADIWLKAMPSSVMDKAKTAPSGDKHDYFSLAPYFWPNPSKPDGLPWIYRDGKVNPESRVGTDHDTLAKMCSQVETLALAYHFTHHEPYADKAALLLKVWFLDSATKMNPNLEYAQGIPGQNTGNRSGIIDTVSLIKITESAEWLTGAAAWTPELERGLREWFQSYLHWLRTSKNGIAEAESANGHSSWCLVQTAAYAIFVGDKAEARKAVEKGRERVAKQIEPDGRQPLELKRTKSYSYTLYNLDALFTLAEIGQRVGVDLFGFRTKDGRSLRAALDYVVPYFSSDKQWPDEQIEAIKKPDAALGCLLRRAAIAYHEPKYEALLQGAKLADRRFQLIWPPRLSTTD